MKESLKKSRRLLRPFFTMLLAKLISEVCLVPFSKVKSRTFANAYKNRGISFMARANGRNIVGCYTLRPFAHPVACCCVLLHKSFKSVKLLGKCKRTQQLLKLLAQKCWELLRPFVRSLKYLGGKGVTPRVFTRLLACRHPGHMLLKVTIFFFR